MSAVTLETLRADFDAAIDSYGRHHFHTQVEDGIDACVHYMRCNRDFGTPLSDHSRNLVIAADLFDVARKHGLEAAMLYKLSDGAIDPRKGGDA